MRKIPVAKHLTDQEYRVLMEVYARHNSSMGLKERSGYTLSSITKIIRNKKENCLDVHYSDGNWWHYMPDGSWY